MPLFSGILGQLLLSNLSTDLQTIPCTNRFFLNLLLGQLSLQCTALNPEHDGQTFLNIQLLFEQADAGRVSVMAETVRRAEEAVCAHE